MSQVSQTCGSGTSIEKSDLLGIGVGVVDDSSIDVDCIKLSPSSIGSPERNLKNDDATSLAYVVKTPRADSKLILQNMEEVLNSVKRKHKQKHRRKKELKKLALQEAEAAAAAAENGAANSADSSTKVSQKSSPKHPLQESKKNTDEIGGELKSPLKNATILDHFTRTPKKQEAESSQPLVKEEEGVTTVKAAAAAKKANAFEVMMNARNKSIGSNTPGKEPTPTSDQPDDGHKIAHVKRKTALQEWADRKGGIKRRLDDEATEAYIEKAMKHRAKRFKALLTNGNESKPEEKPVKMVIDKQTDKTPEVKSSSTKASQQVKQTKTTSSRKPATKRKSRLSRRLSSVDSIESIDNPSQDDSSGFLAKLSSPIKKRDSLLGYFPKKPSPVVEIEVKQKLPPQVEAAVGENITPKRGKGRPPKKEKLKASIPKEIEEAAAAVVVEEVETPELSTTGSGRPKRQCSRKSRYDVDLSPVSTKTEQEKQLTRSVKKLPVLKLEQEEPELQIIDVDSDSPKQTPKKLAPLFIKAVPKPSVDPELLRAKQQFLMSGVPEKMRLEMAKQKQYEQSYEEAIEEFPSVSHIRQLSPEEDNTNKETFAITFKLRPNNNEDEEDQKTPSRKLKKRAIGTFTTCTQKDFRVQPRNMLTGLNPLTQIDQKRQIIKDWKVTYDRFPTFRCYNQLREKYRHFCAIDSEQEAEQFNDTIVVTRSSSRRSLQKAKFDPDAEEEKPPPSAPNGELLFTEKYKAMSSDQVLVNVAPVNQLKEFLSSWRGISRANESNPFGDMNDSSNSSSAFCNSVVLVGPNSSGKTNAVFALANEMNFAVLEVNAGMKRTGRKLLQELQEATQSHQIRKDSKVKSKTLLKSTLNGNKKKRQSGEETSTANDDFEQSTRKSLILIEDADIIFEQHDHGFIDALYTLASTSKRPVIIMATNPNCQHLQRLINQNVIYFAPANVLNISKFLSVLSLIENCPVELNDLVSLYLLNRKHLRKTILEMQFYIQSGGDRLAKSSIKKTPSSSSCDDKGNSSSQFFASPNKRRFSEETNQVTESTIDDDCEKNKKKPHSAASSSTTEVNFHKGLFEFYTVCQNMKCRIPFPVDFHLLRTNLTDIFNVSRNLTETNASTRRKSKSPKKAWLCAANRPSVTRSLSDFYENLSTATMIAGVQEREDGLTNNLSEDVAHCLVERAIEKNLVAGHYAYNLFDSPQVGITLTNFSPVTPLRSSRSLALDYEPSLRSICRSEKIRSSCDRRGSRFYHYLRNSCVNLGSFSTDNFENACDILHDPSDIEIISLPSSSQKSE